MPTYLIHGFRWTRAAIRIHIIINDLEDAAPEWVLAPATSTTLLNSFYTLYDFLPPSHPPVRESLAETEQLVGAGEREQEKEKERGNTLSKRGTKAGFASLGRGSRPKDLNPSSNWGGKENGIGDRPHWTEAQAERKKAECREREKKIPVFNDWSVVKFLEQYDPDDLHATSQPYAYVGDYMVEVPLSIDINDEVAKYEARQKAEEAPLSPGTPGTPGWDRGGLSVRDIRKKSRRLGWFEKLRDGLQKGADIGWFVVVCGDEERAVEDSSEKGGTSEGTEGEAGKKSKSGTIRGLFKWKESPVMNETMAGRAGFD